MAAPTIVQKGVTTLTWGTTGLIGTPSGMIVESIKITPLHAKPVAEMENGDGAVVNQMILAGASIGVSDFDATVEGTPTAGNLATLVAAIAGDTVTLYYLGVLHNCTLQSVAESKTKKDYGKVTIEITHRGFIND
jgi:hypothetical protein